MVAGSFFIAALLCLPMIIRVVTFRRPLVASDDATHFNGIYHRWRLSHATGEVVASSTHTRTYGGGNLTGSVYSGVVTGSSSVRTDLHDNIRLRLADGSQRDAEMINYNVAAQPGDVLSVWNAHHGSRGFTIAVLNHTTHSQNVNAQDVFKILQPHQGLFLGWLVFSILPLAFLAVAGGGLPLLLFFVVGFLYYRGQKRVRGRFAKSGIRPIWQLSESEAGPLLAAH